MYPIDTHIFEPYGCTKCNSTHDQNCTLCSALPIAGLDAVMSKHVRGTMDKYADALKALAD